MHFTICYSITLYFQEIFFIQRNCKNKFHNIIHCYCLSRFSKTKSITVCIVGMNSGYFGYGLLKYLFMCKYKAAKSLEKYIISNKPASLIQWLA